VTVTEAAICSLPTVTASSLITWTLGGKCSTSHSPMTSGVHRENRVLTCRAHHEDGHAATRSDLGRPLHAALNPGRERAHHPEFWQAAAPTEEARGHGASRLTTARVTCEIDCLVTSNHFKHQQQGLNISEDRPCEISNQPTGQRIVGIDTRPSLKQLMR
jgi:hypothetical protein